MKMLENLLLFWFNEEVLVLKWMDLILNRRCFEVKKCNFIFVCCVIYFRGMSLMRRGVDYWLLNIVKYYYFLMVFELELIFFN